MNVSVIHKPSPAMAPTNSTNKMKPSTAASRMRLHLSRLLLSGGGSRQIALQVLALCLSAVILICVLVPRVVSTNTTSETEARTALGVSSPSAARRFVPPRTEQEDLFISVKTSRKFHESRLGVVLKTWFQLARDQIWFFTDAEDEAVNEKTSKSHYIHSIICKDSE